MLFSLKSIVIIIMISFGKCFFCYETFGKNEVVKRGIMSSSKLEYGFDDNEVGEDKLYFENAKIPSLYDLIPIKVNMYYEALNINLMKCMSSTDKANSFRKNVFTLTKKNTSYVVLYSFKSLLDKAWASRLNKNKNNKTILYIKNHFDVQAGFFYARNTHYNYFEYKIKPSSVGKERDVSTDVGVEILRLGPSFKFAWNMDTSNKFNISVMVSGGWQTNVFGICDCTCCCNKSNSWIFLMKDYKGLDDTGLCKEFRKLDIGLNNWYFLVQIDFGIYFGKLYFRFNSPISNKNDLQCKVIPKMPENSACELKYLEGGGAINKDDTKKLIFNKWTMSIGLALSSF